MGANKSRVMYRANFNFLRFKRYFYLLNNGLIVEVNNPTSGKVVYKTTDEGEALLKVLKKAERFISL
jgi:predicted transcriptional regulator